VHFQRYQALLAVGILSLLVGCDDVDKPGVKTKPGSVQRSGAVRTTIERYPRNPELEAAIKARDKAAALKLIAEGTAVTAYDEVHRSLLLLACESQMPTVAVKMLDAGAEHGGWHRGYGLIHIAAANNQMQVVKRLLQLGQAVDETSWSGTTPLMEAARSGQHDMAMFLISQGARKYKMNDDNVTLLHYAAEGNLVELMDQLIAEGMKPDVADDRGDTPLFYALRGDALDALKRLIEHGANPYAFDNHDWSILDISTFKKEPTKTDRWVQRYFKEHPAPDGVASRAQLYRQKLGKLAKEIRRRIKAGESLDVEDNKGHSLLHQAVVVKDLASVTLLLEHGFDSNVTHPKDGTPLHIAADRGATQIAALLLKHGARTDLRDYLGATPLHDATLDICKMLLDVGADVDALSNEQATPLHWACTLGKAKIARLLVERGANVRIRNDDSYEPAMECLLRGDDPELLRFLMDHGSTPTIPIAAALDDMDLLKQLVPPEQPHPAGLNEPERGGMRPLHYAAGFGSLRALDYLVKRGAEVDSFGDLRTTPMQWAVIAGQTETVTRLMELGAKIDLRRRASRTALHDAAEFKDAAMVQLLLDHSANVGVVDSRGRTPLHFAAKRGDVSIIETLLKAGADPSIKDRDGQTPLGLAKSARKDAAIKLLEDASGG